MTLKIEISGDLTASIISGNENSYSEISVTTTPSVIPTSASRVFFNVGGTALSTLPDAVTWAADNPSGELLLKDISGNVGAGITINRAGMNTIDRLISITITRNFAFYVLCVVSGDWTIVG